LYFWAGDVTVVPVREARSYPHHPQKLGTRRVALGASLVVLEARKKSAPFF
jgi:hypothetical protein